MYKRNTVDFIGIGAIKSGSTWLNACLEAHPKVLCSSRKGNKELWFFNKQHPFVPSFKDKNYRKGIEWYLRQFPTYQKEGQVRGEFSVLYLADNAAPYRIKQHFPKAKIIAILRNPVRMVYSLYWYLKPSVHPYGVPDNFDKAVLDGRFNDLYCELGLYYKHLKTYFSLFPADQIKVFLLDDVKKNPLGVVRELYSFLGVDPDFEPKCLNRRINKAKKVRSEYLRRVGVWLMNFSKNKKWLYSRFFESNLLYHVYDIVNRTDFAYPNMSYVAKKKLYEYYKDDIAKLETLISRDLSGWKL